MTFVAHFDRFVLNYFFSKKVRLDILNVELYCLRKKIVKNMLRIKFVNLKLPSKVNLNQLFWQHHAKTYLRANADSEGPDQPAHLRSLIRTFIVR